MYISQSDLALKPVQILCEGRAERRVACHAVLHKTPTRCLQDRCRVPYTGPPPAPHAAVGVAEATSDEILPV